VTTRLLISGAEVFKLKATHGLPLDFSVDRIINKAGHAIAWAGFVDEARRNGWWDFQIFQCVDDGLFDAEVPQAMRHEISQRLKGYMLQQPRIENGDQRSE
jgi:hypothetical protein